MRLSMRAKKLAAAAGCKRRSTRPRLASAAIFTMALAACGSAPPKEGIPGQGTAPTTFGRIVALRDGEPQKLGVSADFACYAVVRSEAENRGLVLPIEQEGWFAWALKPGDHIFSDLYCEVRGMEYRLALDMRFKVETETFYIGQLGFNYKDTGFHNVLWTTNEEEARKEFIARYPGAAPVTQTAIDDRGPGNYKSVDSICSPRWGLTCGRDLQGVEPIDPAVAWAASGLAFATVDSLKPTLRWKPAAKSGVTYDLAVWEAFVYRPRFHMSDDFAPGRVAVYVENIRSTELTLSDGLKPKTKYFWSVRLRDGDWVTTWSRGGQSITFRSGFEGLQKITSSGQWFGFETR